MSGRTVTPKGQSGALTGSIEEPVYWVSVNSRTREDLLLRGGALLVGGVGMLAVMLGIWSWLPSAGAPDLLIVAIPTLISAMGALLLYYGQGLLRAVGRTWDGIDFDKGSHKVHLDIDSIVSMRPGRTALRTLQLEVTTADGGTIQVKGVARPMIEELARFVSDRQAERFGASVAATTQAGPGIGRARLAEAGAGPPERDEATTRWNASTLADGREIADSRMVFQSSETGAVRPVGVWMSLPPKNNQALAVMAVFMAFSFPLMMAIVALGARGAVGILVAVAAGGVCSLPVVYVAYFQLLGQSGYCILALPESFASLEAAGTLVDSVARKAGRSASGPRKRWMWEAWSLDRFVKFRFLGPMGGTSARLTLQTMKDPNAQLHRRLKGLVLEGLGIVPVEPGAVASVGTGTASPARPMIVEAFRPRGPLARPPAPPAMDGPPSWAWTVRPSSGEAVADARLGAAGTPDMANGWWGSRPPALRLERAQRMVILFVGGTFIAVSAMVLVPAVMVGGPTIRLSTIISLVGFMGVLAVLSIGFLAFMFRRENKKTLELSAACFLRFDPGPGGPVEAVSRIDAGLRAWTPWVRPRTAGGDVVARWEDAAAALVLVLEAPDAKGGLLLTLNSKRKGAEVARTKGAVEAGLFG